MIFEDYDKKKFEKEQKIKTLETQLLDLKNVLDKKEKNLTEMKKEVNLINNLILKLLIETKKR